MREEREREREEKEEDEEIKPEKEEEELTVNETLAESPSSMKFSSLRR